MTRGLLVLITFISAIFLPWQFTALLALVSSIFIPLLPLAIGILADTLYYVPNASSVIIFTFYGAIATGIALLVRSRLKTSIIIG